VNLGGDYLLTRGRNERPDSTVSNATFSRHTWENGWCPGSSVINGPCAAGTYTASGLPVLTSPCLACVGNLGRNTFVGPGLWTTDLTLSKDFKLTERFKLKFDAAAFNVFNRANFQMASGGGYAHNDMRDSLFGEAGTTGSPRVMQFGVKLSF
jgi:hypothetical protein